MNRVFMRILKMCKWLLNIWKYIDFTQNNGKANYR